jgi:hypothetical protein
LATYLRTACRGLPLFALPFAAAACVASGAPAKAAVVQTAPTASHQRFQAALNAMEDCLRRAGYRMVGPPQGDRTSVDVIAPDEADRKIRSDAGYAVAYHRCAKQVGFDQPSPTAGAAAP